jgi:hypothetical protein
MACPTCSLIRGLLLGAGISEETSQAVAYSQPVQTVDAGLKKKARKKVSKYQREFGRQLKALKRKHPRTQIQNLMKRAHRATKKVLK